VRREARSGKHVSRALLIVVVLVAVAIAPAVSSAITIQLGGEVYKENCTYCHANYAVVKDLNINFTHGSHISTACSACHTESPHGPGGLIKRVPMKECFNCHGLTHGPQGEMATSLCSDCHKAGPIKLRPSSHTTDWKNKPHVAPSLAKTNTECAMCHTISDCNSCHLKEGVEWKPKQAFAYDVGNGCQACHGNPNLTKLSNGLIKSYQVVGVDSSAHRDITCVQCHVDFTYGDDAPEPKTKLWNVNAGLSCAECHDHDDQKAAYESSIHAEGIAKKNYASATCGSCHGGHTIPLTDTEEASMTIHASSYDMCGKCHTDYYDNYSDYYHGAAYKAGAEDAPACWQCHDYHGIQPKADKESSVNPANLAASCGSGSCHDQHGTASEDFTRSSAGMIHGKADVRANNPVLKLIGSVFGGGS
jgi:cytochrome c5